MLKRWFLRATDTRCTAALVDHLPTDTAYFGIESFNRLDLTDQTLEANNASKLVVSLDWAILSRHEHSGYFPPSQ